MRRTPVRAAAVAAMLTVAVVLPVAAGAGGRIPVDSVDDPASPTANRIAAVTNIVVATYARLERVIVAYPPNPCEGATELELAPLCSSAVATLAAFSALGESVNDVCAGRALEGPGDVVIADADAFAGDSSATGIANQLGSIATVLGNADDRLGGIQLPNPGPPNDPAILGALYTLAEAVHVGEATAATWLLAVPPNPVCPRVAAG